MAASKNEKAAMPGGSFTSDFDCNGHYTSTGWERCTPRRPCPICHRQKFCRLSPDGQLVECTRVDAGSFRTTRNRSGETYLHRIREDRAWRPPAPAEGRARPVPSVASVEHRHAVYTALLDALPLSAAHADALRARGLTDAVVTANRYATAPDADTLRRTLTDLGSRFDLTGVPGVYGTRGDWRGVARPGDLLIPSRDPDGRIRGIRRRCDDPARSRYSWMSGGRSPSCGSPAHYARPLMADSYRDRPVVITEGELKGDVIARRLECTVIGLAGIGTIPLDLVTEMKTAYPELSRICLAPDADYRTNEHVGAAVTLLVNTLTAAGYRVTLLVWDDEAGKGLDDVIRGAV